MQILCTPAGGGVVVMQAKEILIMELALSSFVVERPDSRLAAQMLADVSRENERRENEMEQAAETCSGG